METPYEVPKSAKCTGMTYVSQGYFAIDTSYIHKIRYYALNLIPLYIRKIVQFTPNLQ